MPAPSASGFDLLCRNTTIATADRQQTNATTITALVVARMPKFIVGPQPVGTSRVFPQPARRKRCNSDSKNDRGIRKLVVWEGAGSSTAGRLSEANDGERQCRQRYAKIDQSGRELGESF